MSVQWPPTGPTITGVGRWRTVPNEGQWQTVVAVKGKPADQGSVVAAFSAGFRLNASHGGYYGEGRTAVPLQDGAASLVIDDNGVANRRRVFRLYLNQKVPPNRYLSL